MSGQNTNKPQDGKDFMAYYLESLALVQWLRRLLLNEIGVEEINRSLRQVECYW